MTRKLVLAISLASLSFASMHALALGVGEANVKSSLNQPLAAEIELLSVGELTEAEILPALATREEFDRAGVDRVFFLSDIRFNVVKNPAGKLVISLSSKKPVRDPYLNFLVEIIWPSGRLLREYSLLIDPPVFSQQTAAPVQSAQVSSAPFASAPARQPSYAQPGASQQVVRGDQINLNTSSVGSQAGGSLAPGENYGPTRSDDTLWELALKARPDRSVSPQQVMLAIQDVNPDAFIDGNINKMKEGVVLRMPTHEQMTRRNKVDAVNAVIAQNEALRPARSKSIVSTTQPTGPSEVSDSASTQAQRDELKLIVANSGSSQSSSAHSGTADAGSGTASKEELALTLEKLDQAVSEKKELSGRVADLEEQLETLQRLLTLKNDQLAGIQEQMRANAATQEAQAKAEESAAATPVEATAVTTPEPALAAPEAEVEAPAGETTQVPVAPGETAAVDAAAPAPAEVPAEAPVQQADVQSTVPVESEKPANKSFVEKLFTDPVYMAGASVGILLLMILVWMVSRNNARKEEALRASSLDDQDDLFADTKAPVSDSAVFSADLDEALDEAAQASDKDAVAEGESKRADVIAEADVYIAYGRLDRAAVILEQAIAEEPLRTDLRLKLLEVYKESGSKQNFERQFSELEAIRDPAAIAAASLLRNELFDRDLLALEEDDVALTDEDFSTGSVDLEEQAVRDQSSDLSQSELEREVMDSFDFDETDKDQDRDQAVADIDFDAEDIDLDVDLSKDLDEHDESFESGLSLDLDEESAPSSRRELDTPSAHEFELSDDLADMESAKSLDEASVDLDLSDIDLSDELEQEKEIDIPEDLSIPEELTETKPVKSAAPVISDDILKEAEDAFREVQDLDGDLGEDEEFDFLEGADEASTKLDLARAYIDMGDLDGARDILEEVCKEGNADQQKEAKALLSELDE